MSECIACPRGWGCGGVRGSLSRIVEPTAVLASVTRQSTPSSRPPYVRIVGPHCEHWLKLIFDRVSALFYDADTGAAVFERIN